MKLFGPRWKGHARRSLLLILATTAGKALLFSLSLFGSAFAVCKFRYWRDPHSAFFDDTHVYDLRYSLHREHEAQQYISAYNAEVDQPSATKASQNPIICAAITTVKRDSVNYLDASVGSLLAGLYPEERSALLVKVFFADTEPQKHPSRNQRWLDSLADSASSYDVSEEEMERLRALEGSRNFQEKGVYDYVYMLDSCYRTNTPYIAVFEDDIIAADAWLAKSLIGLSRLEERPRLSDSRLDWLYLRLFYTETSLSWTNDDFWYRNMPLAFALTMGVALTILVTARRVSRAARPSPGWPTIAVVCLVTIPAFTGLVFMMGKYNVMPLQGVVEMNKHGCCTQGMIFPRDQVPDLIQYVLAGTKVGTDRFAY